MSRVGPNRPSQITIPFQKNQLKAATSKTVIAKSEIRIRKSGKTPKSDQPRKSPSK